jgi:transcriptional regulator with XRE-family HTH domain
MSEGIGARLRAERERHGVSLSTIAASTKISVSLFEGLERDDVSRWPQGIFRRAFVREYARAIGLDPEETLNDFLERFPDPLAAPAPGEDDQAGAGSPGGNGNPERLRRPRTVLRLTLADMPGSHAGGRPLVGIGKRCAAVALDATAVVAVALALYVALGSFWLSLAVFTFCYYTGATLVLGNTPAVRFFASRAPGPRRRDDSGDHYFDGIGAMASVSDPLSSS